MASKGHLYYHVVEEAVIAPAELAVRSDRIHRAIEKSRTWGGFRRLMPPDDYEALMRSQFDDDGEPRPCASDKFSAECVHGYADGDYPTWLQPQMAQWIPEELLRKYGSWELTTLNGPYWAIPGSNTPQLVDELRKIGYTVTERSDLDFA